MENENVERKKSKSFFLSLSKGIRLLIISLIMLCVGLISSFSVDNLGGSLEVTSLVFPTENGQYLAADLYKPKSATVDNKAPCIVVCPGFQRTKETQQSWTTELARRGNVVIVMDPYSQGDSSSSDSSQAATAYGYGLFSLIDYITTKSVNGGYVLNYIDQAKIGACGHSAGGNACVKAANRFGQEVIDGKVKKSRLSAIYVSGFIRSFTSSDLGAIRCNMGMSYAYYDEGAYQNQTQTSKDNGTWAYDMNIANGDMRYAPEALLFVNSGLTLNGEASLETIEIGEIYGNPYTNTLRIVNKEHTIHALQPYDFNSIGNFISYWELGLDLEFALPSSNQIWIIRELGTGLMLVGGFILLFALGDILLKTKFFASLKNDLVEESDHKKPIDKVVFWVVFAASAIIACFIFIPCAQWSQSLFSSAQNGIQTWFFPERMNNGVMVWAICSGLIGFSLFFLVYAFNKFFRKEETDLTPFKIKWKDLAKTLLLGVILFSSFYILDLLIYTFFHVDFRFMFIAARPVVDIKMIGVFLMYLPLFFIFYFSNSLRVNLSMRIKGMKDWVSTLIGCLGNSVGLILIMIIQYSVFASTGQVNWTTEWLYCNMLFSVIPMMFILPIFNRYFFNRTGKLYLGPLVSSMVFIMMMLTNSVCYLPF